VDERLVLDAPAKLNLCLRIVGRRDDGYHLLQSIVTFVDLADRVWLGAAAGWRLRLSGPFASALAGEDNLALRAGRLLAAEATADIAGCATLAADVTIEKNIPVAAGLGGGSADAAAVLRGLDHLWGLKLSEERLREIAAPLGADLAVCLASVASAVSGTGDRLAQIALPPLALVLANPGIALATKDVFARLRPPYAAALEMPEVVSDLDGLVRIAREFGNGLTAPAIALCPTIATVLDDLAALDGSRLAQMSGSGASCFALFDDDEAAIAAAEELRRRRPAWLVRAVRALPG